MWGYVQVCPFVWRADWCLQSPLTIGSLDQKKCRILQAELVPLVGRSLASISERCRELDSVRAILRTPGIVIDPTVEALPEQITALVDHFTSLQTARNANAVE